MTRVLVAGAGAFGSAIAVALAQAGAEVILADPAPFGANASGVAAGMLAPAFEAVLDPSSAEHFELLRAARDLWPAFAARLNGRDIGLARSGARWLDEPGATTAKQLALRDALMQRGASVNLGPSGLFTAEDWRLEPLLALGAFHAAAKQAGAIIVAAGLASIEDGRAILSDGRSIDGARIVLATGALVSSHAPELARLSPIAGQILRFPSARRIQNAPTLRFAGGYRVESERGRWVGATMEPGAVVDARLIEPLFLTAQALFPDLKGLDPEVLSGVRAATPDGLPMVGPSARPGVFLAVGARRNGWLLAPLVATMTAAYLAGADPGPRAPAFDPRRFDRV